MKAPVSAIAPDARVENHGSIVLVRPLTDSASEWIDANVDVNAQWWAGAVACEPRYVSDIVNGMLSDGLVLSIDGKLVS
jgi:hypothetical protein